MVVTSSAVAANNPEVLEARARKIPVIQRAEMLAELMRLKYGIAVAGMHGKTTTTAMIAAVLGAGGGEAIWIQPWWWADAWTRWGRMRGWGRRSTWWRKPTRATGRFLKLSPVLAVVTNLDREHMDCYRDMADVEGAFVSLWTGCRSTGRRRLAWTMRCCAGCWIVSTGRCTPTANRAEADFRLQLIGNPVKTQV